jgi:hypothetical protein
LNLIELSNLAPGLVADGAGDVDFKLQYRHKKIASLQTRTGQCPRKDAHSD